MNKKEKIIHWLKDKGVFEQFCNNSFNRNLLVNQLTIQRTFNWIGSPEGYNFWSKIDEEYRDWYRKEFADEFLYMNFKEY